MKIRWWAVWLAWMTLPWRGAYAGEVGVISKSFELRYVTDDPRGSGPTDFKGETQVFNTEERITFLERYASYAKRYFEDPGLDKDVVTMAEARERLKAVKPQPSPEVRRRVPLTAWHWLGYRRDENRLHACAMESWKVAGVDVQDGSLQFLAGDVRIERRIPEQPWRFFLTWRARWPSDGRHELAVGDAAAVSVAGRRITYRSGGRAVEGGDCAAGAWHAFKLEIDLAEQRYNLLVDGTTVADFVPLAAPAVKKVDAFLVKGSPGTSFDDVWGVGYVPTREPRQPYAIRTFIDETFALKPDPEGWAAPGYDDSGWAIASTPIIHGGERHAGEDLYLRTQVAVGPYERAVLRIEGVEPEADLFINGRHAGHIPAPVPTRLDVTRFLRPQESNTLALRVSHFRHTEPDSHHSPLDTHVGWYAARMWLDFTAPVFVEELLVHAETVGDPACLQPRITLRHEGSSEFRGFLAIRAARWFPEEAVGPSGEAVVPVAIPAGGSVTVQQVVAVKAPLLWTPRSPNLYKVSATLRDERQQAVDDEVVTTGIRTVGQGGGTFRINGEPALSTGALLLGYRMPIDQLVVTRAWSPDDWIVRELLQIRRMGGNTARTGFLRAEPPRFAEIGDQLGVMFLWETAAGRWWGDPMAVDFANYPAYMRQVYNHPSIIMWEVVNEPSVKDYDHLNRFYTRAYATLYAVDRSRLICLNTNLKHSRFSGNDTGTVDMEGRPNPYPHAAAWTASRVTRSHHVHLTGYGAEWTALRAWPGAESSFLDSNDRAYFNTEHEESIGQPNWSFDRGKPSYRLFSYEWPYDEGSIGRKLTADEWQTSQAWQAFSAYESMRRQRIFDIDGFSWCSLHGGANSGTYQKPLLDNYGHAKLAYWAVRMANQDVLAGSADVDVVYGPGDRIAPVVLNLGEAREVTVRIHVNHIDGKTAASRSYERVRLPGGRTVTPLAPWRPDLPANGHYAVEYIVER